MRAFLLNILIIMVACGNNLIPIYANQEIDNSIDIYRIKNDISKYNKNFNDYFESVILEKFTHQISKAELDSLIIIPDPMFMVNDQCKVRPELVDKDYNNGIIYHDTKDYYILNMYGNGSIYNCIIETYPFSYNKRIGDTIRTILRLYTPSKKHKYNILLVQPALFDWFDFDRIHSIDNNNIEVIDSIYKKYENIPMDYICLCLDIQRLELAKCVIIKDKIYSIGCMRNKYPKFPYSEIFKLSPEELESCDINNCFTPPK